MNVAFDATVLVYLLDERANPPVDVRTGTPVDRCPERVRALIDSLSHQNAKIVIPTPALAEVLVKAQSAAPEWLRILNASKHFRIASFDERAAIEFAATQASRKRLSGSGVPRQKAKFDDQIVAIATVERAEIIYSDDEDIRRLAGGRFEVIGVADLPLPPEDAQTVLPLPDPPGQPKP